ncbi:hypothetical protein DPEC_G00347920 [Dallia pectoralis]|uniref:Uncharacterized protein n=1 Tax=Dallia pectoralis TaxID=75939 RepID=A0ACC2F4E8_DALPE|nr:hypothetical protein DPEC_G00347920 [Dallia pectoralis]
MYLHHSPLIISSIHHSVFLTLSLRGRRKARPPVVRSVSLASLAPPILLETATTAAGALSNGASATEPRQPSSTATECLSPLMDLPLGEPALRHYTRSRPRPHRLKQHIRPSRPQDLVLNTDCEVPSHTGRVDEGVEEFFTKRVFPVDTLKTQNEDDEPQITEQEVDVAPACTAPCPAPSRTLRRKLGEFFTLRKRRGVKSDGGQEGRAKKTTIADLIRPLRDATRADKVKENKKEKEKESADNSTVTGDSVEAMTLPIGAPTPLRAEAPPRRALREGKSQSLILLSGSAANAGVTKNTAQGKKHSSDGPHGFEQRLQLMLQRIGVSKTQPGESQNQEGEMKKAESEGTIIDTKPEPPQTLMKPRTMSTSSDTRRPVRQSVSAHESAVFPSCFYNNHRHHHFYNTSSQQHHYFYPQFNTYHFLHKNDIRPNDFHYFNPAY